MLPIKQPNTSTHLMVYLTIGTAAGDYVALLHNHYVG